MPGLNQLKKLSEDILSLGNESKLRAERGEKPVVATIPPTVQDIDDSEDFVLGMPKNPDDEIFDDTQDSQSEQEALAAATSGLDSILSENQNSTPTSEQPSEPDLSSLLNPVATEDDSVPDLSAFEPPPEPPKKEEPSIADMDLDALLSMPSEDFSEPESSDESKEKDEPAQSQSQSQNELPEDFEQPTELQPQTIDESDSELQPQTSAEQAQTSAEQTQTSQPSEVDFSSDFEPVDDISDLESADDFQNENVSSVSPITQDANDDFAFTGDSIDMNDDLPDEFNEIPGDSVKDGIQKSNQSVESSSETSNSNDVPSELEDFDLQDLSVEPQDVGVQDLNSEPKDSDSSIDVSSTQDEIPTSGDFGFDPIDTSGLDDFGSMPENLDENVTPEVFDTSEMDGVDFSKSDNSGMPDFNIQDTDSQLNNTSASDSDFENMGEPDFEIEGYTDADANPFDKSGRIKSQIPTKKAEEGKKNTLTDSEYKRFKENLKTYPLNVRIAVEDLVVKNEFTDDVIFDVIDKILKKIPARQLASHLEKLLDIQLSVPRDFERRTAEEYAAYKQSIQYQLRNRIIPAIIIGILIFLLGFCSVYLGIEFIYKPIKAENYYKQGYALIQNNEYPQSETMFNSACELRIKKKWFFRYANAYREHNQYDRAEDMYKNILKIFNHDKQGGLDYVHMELDDLANYSKAENILRREVLYYHINDPDALLLLGDVFLEWATEEDSSKFSDAYEQYSFLIQNYGAENIYLSRLMRYHVRTDSLKDVLVDKEIFYPKPKSLSAADWTEMSGYLMDKLYGDLAPQEEYLRSSIEDVHSMLVRACEQDPSNPISRYNISRYYVYSSDHTNANIELQRTINLFEKTRHMKARDVYKQLNTYRLLGEEYIYNKDYILAQETLTSGIDLFEQKKLESGFESDKNVGIMYSDMADLDYFISGDLENAQRNYENAIANKNDNSSVRYRVGYIQYGNKEYDAAFNNFRIASQDKINDSNILLALGNTLSLRDDNYASAGYYERLVDFLNLKIAKSDIILPQVNEDDTELVETYMKATNNLGVSQFRLARQTGNSSMNGQSIFNFQNSLKAWDALTRNPVSFVRLGGTNLAEQNIKYVTSPIRTYEPAIYTDIPRILENEKILE